MKSTYSIKFLLLIILSFSFSPAFCQENETTIQPNTVTEISTNSSPVKTEKAAIPTTNILYQNKRINLVVFVLAIIFVGIILYLIRIERTLNKAEKK